MTIKTRNILFFMLIIIFAIFLFSYAFMLIYNITNDKLNIPSFTTGNTPFFSKYSYIAVLISLFVFAVYSFFAILFLYIEFEKTQATEVIFFSMFVIGCATETIRIFIPLFNMYNSFSSFFIFIGRITIFGRTLVPASLLFGALFSDTEQRQNVERNIAILIVISALFSIIIPLDTGIILPNFCIKFGFGKTFFIIRLIVLIIAIISLFVNSNILGVKDISPFGFISLAIGYELNCNATSYFVAILGAILLFTGSAIYLWILHKKYLWQ